jgi:hypothetical protein
MFIIFQDRAKNLNQRKSQFNRAQGFTSFQTDYYGFVLRTGEKKREKQQTTD